MRLPQLEPEGALQQGGVHARSNLRQLSQKQLHGLDLQVQPIEQDLRRLSRLCRTCSLGTSRFELLQQTRRQ